MNICGHWLTSHLLVLADVAKFSREFVGSSPKEQSRGINHTGRNSDKQAGEVEKRGAFSRIKIKQATSIPSSKCSSECSSTVIISLRGFHEGNKVPEESQTRCCCASDANDKKTTSECDNFRGRKNYIETIRKRQEKSFCKIATYKPLDNSPSVAGKEKMFNIIRINVSLLLFLITTFLLTIKTTPTQGKSRRRDKNDFNASQVK